MHNKKGVSPLIATVLVIGFTVVLAALVITLGTRLFQTTVSETEMQSTFSVACSTGLKVEVTNRGSAPAAEDREWRVTLRNNNQDQSINGFSVVLNFGEGISRLGDIRPTEGGRALVFPLPKTYVIASTSPLGGLESVDLFPELTVDGVTRSCEDPINVEVS